MRARNIKPGFFKNEALGECSPEARLLFIGLWLLADRNGRLEYRPKRWKAEVFPYDNADPVALFAELEAQGLVKTYEADGVACVWIPRFLAHQKPHPRERASVTPAHPEDKGATPNYQEDAQKSPQAQPRRDPGMAKAKPRRCLARLNPDILNPDILNPEEEESPEPPAASGPPSPIAFTFPTVGKTKTEAIRQDELDEWGELFPALDVLQVVRECLAWNTANPTRRKTAGGLRRHIVQWLTREQNKGRGGQGKQAGTPEDDFDRQLAEFRALQAKETRQ